MDKNNVLKNVEQNRLLTEQGFVVLDFFSRQQLNQLLNDIQSEDHLVHGRISSNNNKFIDVTFHSTFLDPDKNYKSMINKHLVKFIQPFLEQYFHNHKIIQANIFNKAPGTGFIAPHQNLTTVDEEEHCSVSIWIPLSDTTDNNGALCFLPGSHRYFEDYRNADIHWAPMNASSDIKDYNMVSVPLKAGQLLIFNDRIIHGSPVNNSDQDRLVFHYLAIPVSASAVYCKKSGNEISIIKVNDDFWFNHTPGDDAPEGTVIKRRPFIIKKYTLENLLSEMDHGTERDK